MKNKVVKTLAICAMVGVIGIGGAMAYFTDADTATNTFTVGKVAIELSEPSWVPPTDITPNAEFAKDPKITNNGVNDAYVFLKVKVPVKNVITAGQDGKKAGAAAKTELFSFLNTSDEWNEFKTAEDEQIKGQDYKVHYFVYGTSSECTALPADAGAGTENVTPALFDKVKFANVIEGQGLEEQSFDIIVEAYGIQTSDLNGVGEAGKTAPTDVWAVLSTQTPSVDAVGVVNPTPGV